ncbi:hypothetical protein L842_0228 [Mycobacterium intracellulare MIN_052511_1280]|nr:hypothetical protein L842_0228 [Mycobacterium intracellulare MIN_052511_1280]
MAVQLAALERHRELGRCAPNRCIDGTEGTRICTGHTLIKIGALAA